MKLYFRDGVLIVHSMLLNQSMSHNGIHLSNNFKIFIDHQENLYKNIPLMLGSLCIMLLLMIIKYGILCSEMMIWIMLPLIYITIKHSWKSLTLLQPKMHVMSMKLLYHQLLIHSNIQFGLVNGLWLLMYVLTGLEDSMMQIFKVNILAQEMHAHIHTSKINQISTEKLQYWDHLIKINGFKQTSILENAQVIQLILRKLMLKQLQDVLSKHLILTLMLQ